MDTVGSNTIQQEHLPPLVNIRHKKWKGAAHDVIATRNGIEESVVREILKVGLEGKDNVDKFLLSEDPEIRKFCRRLKMERRLRHDQSLTDEEKSQKIPSATENQLSGSTFRIHELIEDSLRSITNVRVAAIQNEEERQGKEKRRKEEIETLIKEEAAHAQDKFEEINSKWVMISKKKDPLEIHEETEKQRDDCVALLEQKDVIIDNLKSRLKQADREFYDELTRQNDYINILSDRINDQMSLMSDCYRKELQNLQSVINTEKDEVLEQRVHQWGAMSEMKEWLELENISKRSNYLQQYEEHIDSMLIDQHELMRSNKTQMEAKLNLLTLEESRFRSAVLISSELLNYNVQILQKRQDENWIVKRQQKRISNKLQETVHRLRQQQRDEMNRLQTEKKQLLDEMRKTMKNVQTARERLKILAAASDKRFFQLWDYNQEAAEGLMNEILHLDRKFHKELLYVPWRAPRMEFSKLSMPSYMQRKDLIHGGSEGPNKSSIWKNVKDGDIEKLSSLIIDSVRKRSNFLMDDNLNIFLQPFSEQSRSLITVHHIFETLGVKTKQDVEYMLQFFRPYIECKQCQETETSKAYKVTEERAQIGMESIDAVSKRLSRQLTQMSQIKESFMADEDNFQIMRGEVEFDVKKEGTVPGKQRQMVAVCNKPDHHPTINFYHVAQALKKFVVKLNEERRWKHFISFEETPGEKMSLSRCLSKQDVENFWEGMPKVFPEKKRLLWKTMLTQMKEYYKMLLKRNQLKHETRKLERQSIELRRLLMRYLQQEHKRENM